jgi:hypothetical protein
VDVLRTELSALEGFGTGPTSKRVASTAFKTCSWPRDRTIRARNAQIRRASCGNVGTPCPSDTQHPGDGVSGAQNVSLEIYSLTEILRAPQLVNNDTACYETRTFIIVFATQHRVLNILNPAHFFLSSSIKMTLPNLFPGSVRMLVLITTKLNVLLVPVCAWVVSPV